MEAMTVRPPLARDRIVCTSFKAVVESNPDVGCKSTGGERKGFSAMCSHSLGRGLKRRKMEGSAQQGVPFGKEQSG
jgi:hypothetical protein